MQRLADAKFDFIWDSGTVEHHSFSAADAAAGRTGDFMLEDAAAHVTAAPEKSVIEMRRENLARLRLGLTRTSRCHVNSAQMERSRFFLRCLDRDRRLSLAADRVAVAEGLAVAKELGDRIDVFEAVHRAQPIRTWRVRRRGATGIRRRSDALLQPRRQGDRSKPEDRHPMKDDARGRTIRAVKSRNTVPKLIALRVTQGYRHWL